MIIEYAKKDLPADGKAAHIPWVGLFACLLCGACDIEIIHSMYLVSTPQLHHHLDMYKLELLFFTLPIFLLNWASLAFYLGFLVLSRNALSRKMSIPHISCAICIAMLNVVLAAASFIYPGR
jgi:hypothetical protein